MLVAHEASAAPEPGPSSVMDTGAVTGLSKSLLAGAALLQTSTNSEHRSSLTRWSEMPKIKITSMLSAPLLSEAMAEFAHELRLLLQNNGQQELAAQVQGLRIVDRCRCGDDFCATFYSEPRPDGAWASLGQHECLTLNAEEGMIILDLVNRRIVCVEVLDRQDVRDRLHDVMP